MAQSNKAFNHLFWTGLLVILAITSIISVGSYLAGKKVGENTTAKEALEPIHDTLRIEVIKEVQIPCTLPHAKPIIPKKPEEKSQKDTAASNI